MSEPLIMTVEKADPPFARVSRLPENAAEVTQMTDFCVTHNCVRFIGDSPQYRLTFTDGGAEEWSLIMLMCTAARHKG